MSPSAVAVCAAITRTASLPPPAVEGSQSTVSPSAERGSGHVSCNTAPASASASSVSVSVSSCTASVGSSVGDSPTRRWNCAVHCASCASQWASGGAGVDKRGREAPPAAPPLPTACAAGAGCRARATRRTKVRSSNASPLPPTASASPSPAARRCCMAMSSVAGGDAAAAACQGEEWSRQRTSIWWDAPLYSATTDGGRSRVCCVAGKSLT